jgi:RNase P subunit RPR2
MTNMENANSASVSVSSNKGFKKDKSNEGKGLYSSEILRAQGIKHPGKNAIYIAASKKSSICPRCYPDVGEAVECSNHDSKYSRCLLMTCTKCPIFKYGHFASHCLQKST